MSLWIPHACLCFVRVCVQARTARVDQCATSCERCPDFDSVFAFVVGWSWLARTPSVTQVLFGWYTARESQKKHNCTQCLRRSTCGGVSGAPSINTTGWQPGERPPESVQRAIGTPAVAPAEYARGIRPSQTPATRAAENPHAAPYQCIICPLALHTTTRCREGCEQAPGDAPAAASIWSLERHRGTTRILLGLRQLPGPALQRPSPVSSYPLLSRTCCPPAHC